MKRCFLIFFLVSLATVTIAQTVYVTKSGAKYHKSSCSYLKKSSVEKNLNDAIAEGYTACSRCKPATVTSKTSEVKKNNTDTKQTVKKTTVTSGRCQATTKKGTQCKRNAKAGSSYCWQHGG